MFLTIEIPVSYINGKLINISKTEKNTIKIQCNISWVLLLRKINSVKLFEFYFLNV